MLTAAAAWDDFKGAQACLRINEGILKSTDYSILHSDCGHSVKWPAASGIHNDTLRSFDGTWTIAVADL